MMRAVRLLAVLGTVSLAACSDALTSSVDEVTLDSTFPAGSTAGWSVEFADYPVDGDTAIYALQAAVRRLPAPLDTTRHALFVSGSNRSDDLFMYLKRPVAGLTPGAVYQVRYEIDLASRDGSGCMGAGGAPGEAVIVKAGASTAEPTRVVRDGWYRMTVDKGNQSQPGRDAVVLGDIANGSDECSGGPFRMKRLQETQGRVRAAADASGRLWLLVGTDSGYEGITSLYYVRVRAVLRRV